MSDLSLSPEAVKLLWPVLQLVGLFVVLLVGIAGGLWRGFRWLQAQIKVTAEAMLAPIAKDVIETKASVKKAHRRIARLRSDLNLPLDHMDEYETQE